MRRGLLLRLSVLVASLAAASLVIFWITQALPGDVARLILVDGASPQQPATKRAGCWTQGRNERGSRTRHGD